MSLPSEADDGENYLEDPAYHDPEPAPADEADEAPDESGPDLVVVIDSSTIIEIKLRVPAADQWDVFERMLQLVREGRLVFPTQVKRELASERHPDMPGPWTARAARERQYPDPSDETMAEILPFVRELVDANAEPDREPADPYVAAMAWELIEAGYDVAVATEDVVDRLPLKMALATACRNLAIPVWDIATFVTWVRSTMG